MTDTLTGQTAARLARHSIDPRDLRVNDRVVLLKRNDFGLHVAGLYDITDREPDSLQALRTDDMGRTGPGYIGGPFGTVFTDYLVVRESDFRRITNPTPQ